VGPRDVIDAISSAGSFLDGGCAHPMQIAALPLLVPEIADGEARAIQAHFAHKREYMLQGLDALGIRVSHAPEGSFYAWGDLSGLPDGLNQGMDFFKRALEVGVIVVPGGFFDVNPGRRRAGRPSRFRSFARFSFGPQLTVLERGLHQLGQLLGR
jgi:hypothetical protein